MAATRTDPPNVPRITQICPNEPATPGYHMIPGCSRLPVLRSQKQVVSFWSKSGLANMGYQVWLSCPQPTTARLKPATLRWQMIICLNRNYHTGLISGFCQTRQNELNKPATPGWQMILEKRLTSFELPATPRYHMIENKWPKKTLPLRGLSATPGYHKIALCSRP